MVFDTMDGSLKMEFPAVRGTMGKRQYYTAMFPLKVVPRLFRFQDYAELPPEQRAQRILNKKRVPEIARYILENEDGWLFSSLTASFNGEEKFEPVSAKNPNLGTLVLPLETEFLINDGQHRRAAIEDALRENPTIGSETISVVLFPLEGLDRSQQMFSDLNRTVQKTSRSLDILYDQRDPLNEITLAVAEAVPLFRGRVEKDKVSLTVRSPKFITLSSLYDANAALLGRLDDISLDSETLDALQAAATLYWKTVTRNIPEWQMVADGEMKPSEARQGYVHSSAVAFLALGSLGQKLIDHDQDPAYWAGKLGDLKNINWARTNREWQGICMIGTDIVTRRQTREATIRFIEWKLGLQDAPPEPVLPSVEAAAV
jgi:DNA sulfur modification protein DndB